MPYRILIFVTRKEGITPAQFRQHLEDEHIPKFVKTIAPHAPLEVTCHYLARVESGSGERIGATNASRKNAEGSAPVVLIGTPADFTWDALCEVKFRDELHFQQYFARLNEPEIAEKLGEDEFADPAQSKVVVVGGTTVMTVDPSTGSCTTK